jgi:hypothetical protein
MQSLIDRRWYSCEYAKLACAAPRDIWNQQRQYRAHGMTERDLEKTTLGGNKTQLPKRARPKAELTRMSRGSINRCTGGRLDPAIRSGCRGCSLLRNIRRDREVLKSSFRNGGSNSWVLPRSAEDSKHQHSLAFEEQCLGCTRTSKTCVLLLDA